MSITPDTRVGKIEFAENHVEPWTQNSLAMGSSAAAVSAWATTVTSARASYEAQQAAQLAAKDATITLNLAMQAMNNATASIIKQVRAKADLDGNGIYALASLPVPATPSPTPPPAKPTDLVVTLDQTGILNLKWKCPNSPRAGGTIYQLWRRIGAAGEFEYIGGTGKKSFVDSTLPAGSAQVTYQMQAVRSTSAGPWAQFNVNFGVSGAGGGMTAMVSESAPSKIAA